MLGKVVIGFIFCLHCIGANAIAAEATATPAPISGTAPVIEVSSVPEATNTADPAAPIVKTVSLTATTPAPKATPLDPNVKTVKLEPKIRAESPSTIFKIPVSTIRPYLKTSLILDSKEQFMEAPYVVAQNHGQLYGGTGTILYVLGLNETEEFTHQIYKEGQIYHHPVTHEMLGFEALTIATAELAEPAAQGEAAQFKVTSVVEPVEVGSRLFPSYASVLPTQLKMKPANALAGEGYILSTRDGMNEIGLNHVVVISLGQREGIEEGDYLDIYQSNRKVVDTVTKNWRKHEIKLPDLRIGRVLVFQTYEKLSLGLVLEANEIVHLLDKVKSP